MHAAAGPADVAVVTIADFAAEQVIVISAQAAVVGVSGSLMLPPLVGAEEAEEAEADIAPAVHPYVKRHSSVVFARFLWQVVEPLCWVVAM